MLNLMAIGIISLFSGIELKTPIAILRPFDLIVVLLFILRLNITRNHTRIIFPKGLLLVLPFLLLHIVSAFGLDLKNGMRELLQVGLLFLFGLILIYQLRFATTEEVKKLVNWILIGLIFVTLYNIGWHIANGFYVGWKRLDDPKYTFTFLPLLLGFMFIVYKPKSINLYWLLWGAFGVIIFFSGERKALLIYLLLSAVLFSKGKIQYVLLLSFVSFFAIALLSTFVTGDYLSRQLQTVTSPLEGQALTLEDMEAGEMPRSMSNAQRDFAFSTGLELLQKSPFIGIGTNVYTIIVQEQFYYLPEFLTIGIHNEFFRVLVENGILGFFLFTMIWMASFYRSRSYLIEYGERIDIDFDKSKMLLIVVFSPLLISTVFEASGSQAMLILLFVSILPEIILYAMSKQESCLEKEIPEIQVFSFKQAMSLKRGKKCQYQS